MPTGLVELAIVWLDVCAFVCVGTIGFRVVQARTRASALLGLLGLLGLAPVADDGFWGVGGGFGVER